MSKKLNYEDDFETLYLRHEYISRAKNLNPEYLKKYAGIVATTSKIIFNRYEVLFRQVGFDVEDLIGVSNVYMLCYMDLYSIQNNPKAMEKVLKKRNVSSLPQYEIDRIDRNYLINFLRQRLQHYKTLCARKARSIVVGEDKEHYFAETEKSVDVVNKDVLIENYKKYGYRLSSFTEWKRSKKAAMVDDNGNTVDKDGFKLVRVEVTNHFLSEHDYETLVGHDRGEFYKSPDQTLIDREDELKFEAFEDRFNKMTPKQQKLMMRRFVEKNKDNEKYAEELTIARKKIKTTKSVV